MLCFRIIVFALAVLLLSGCSSAQTEGMEEPASGEAAKRQESKRQPRAAEPREHAEKPAEQTTSAPASRSNARAMFKRLRVQEPSTNKYSRDAFKHWVDEDSNGCDTRREVLRRENLNVGAGGRCGAERGEWVSAYDGMASADPQAFEIDHLIPLAEAWRSGADQWPDAKREAFANDLHPFSLIAVSSSSNRSKSDRDPSQWMPPDPNFHCQYVARWIAVKFRWRLAVDRSERRALADTLDSCDAESLQLTLRVKKPKPDAEPAPAPVGKPNTRQRKQKLRLFGTCAEAKRHGFGPYRAGVDPEYHHYRDADSDGLVCE